MRPPRLDQELCKRHKSIVRSHISGLKNVEIARQLAITPGVVSVVINSPAGKKYKGELIERVESEVVLAAALRPLLKAGLI